MGRNKGCDGHAGSRRCVRRPLDNGPEGHRPGLVARCGCDRQFTYAPAQARARAIVHRTDGATYEYEWPDDVQVDMPLELTEIQGNIVAGFNKDHVSYLFFALPNDQAQARRWLVGLADQVATAEEVKQFNDLFRAIRRRRGDREGVVEAAWMNLAFTHEGLRRLSVAESELGRFPSEFREGMRKRKKNIGDVGDNDPDRWPDGLGKRTIHALMIVAADRIEDLDREVVYFVRHAASRGVSLVFQQDGVTGATRPAMSISGSETGSPSRGSAASPGRRTRVVPTTVAYTRTWSPAASSSSVTRGKDRPYRSYRRRARPMIL